MSLPLKTQKLSRCAPSSTTKNISNGSNQYHPQVAVPQTKPRVADVKWEDMAKYAETGEQQWEDSSNASPLAVDIKVTFPDAEIFGIKLVNGRPTRALLHVTNNEEVPVNALVAIGALLSPSNTPGAPDPPIAMRNLTGAKFDTVVQPKTTEILTYAFSTIMNPQDLTLEVKAVVSRGPRIFTVVAFNEKVSIVEAPVSIFDPQMCVAISLVIDFIPLHTDMVSSIFLYTFLLAVVGGISYFIYTTWISTLFPQKKRGGDRSKRAAPKAVETVVVPVVETDGGAIATGSKGYDESWIPATHLQRPQAKRVGSGRPKSRAA